MRSAFDFGVVVVQSRRADERRRAAIGIRSGVAAATPGESPTASASATPPLPSTTSGPPGPRPPRGGPCTASSALGGSFRKRTPSAKTVTRLRFLVVEVAGHHHEMSRAARGDLAQLAFEPEQFRRHGRQRRERRIGRQSRGDHFPQVRREFLPGPSLTPAVPNVTTTPASTSFFAF